MKSVKVLTCLIYLLGAGLMGGCTGALGHRIDIAQGNRFDDAAITQLQLGMQPHQIWYLLGSPMALDPFHPDRWDYLYWHRSGQGELQRRHLRLYFAKGALAEIVTEDRQADRE